MASSSMPPTATAAKTKTAKPKSSKRSLSAWQHGEQGITGVMMESFLVGGHQKPAPLDQLVYGQSVTDSCVPWERTNELLHTLADAVTARRSAK